MGLGKLIAWVLLIAAFFSAAAEIAAQALTGTFGYMSAHDVLYTLIPGKYIVFQGWIEDHVSPTLWNPVLRTVLSLPAWSLFAVPGLALAWACRTRHTPDDETDDRAYTTYEDIVAAAEEADEEAGEYQPSKYADHAEYDPTRADLEDEQDIELLIKEGREAGDGEPPRLGRMTLLPPASEKRAREKKN